MTLAIGVDLGGTHLRAAALRVPAADAPGAAADAPDAAPEAADAAAAPDASAAAPALTASHRELIGADRDPRAIVDRLAVIIERLAGPGALIANAAPIPVGIGAAAMLRDSHGTVARSPHLGWRDVPFGALLRARLGPRFAVGVYNDVNAVTWGEAVAGAARGCRDVLAVYVGTGIGGGVIANGALVDGASSCAGEIGHAKVRWDDDAAPCNCGGRGCVEAYVGGSYLDRRIRREVSEKRTRTSAVQLAGGAAHVTVAHVDQAAAEGDAWALALWTELAPLLAVTLGNALAVLNSERLVLGGGLLSRTPTLVSLVDISLRIVAPPPSLEPLTIVMAELGDDAGIVGAARLAASGVAVAAG